MQKGVRFSTTLLLSVSLLFCAMGFAQTTSGSIAGSVVDAQHASLPNATVNAKDVLQAFTFTTRTDESGRFVFPQVPPGSYTISVEAAGFKRMDRTGITLSANDKLALGELVMEVGAVS